MNSIVQDHGDFMEHEHTKAVGAVAYVEHDDLASIEGFNDEIADELQQRAKEYLEKLAEELDVKRKELGVEDGVLELEGVTLPMAVIFGENDIKTVEDVAKAAAIVFPARAWPIVFPSLFSMAVFVSLAI